MMSITQFFSGFKHGFRQFGIHISEVINFVILLIVYIFGVGFTSIAARLFKKRFIDTGKEKKDSYWVKNKLATRPYKDYLRRF